MSAIEFRHWAGAFAAALILHLALAGLWPLPRQAAEEPPFRGLEIVLGPGGPGPVVAAGAPHPQAAGAGEAPPLAAPAPLAREQARVLTLPDAVAEPEPQVLSALSPWPTPVDAVDPALTARAESRPLEAPEPEAPAAPPVLNASEASLPPPALAPVPGAELAPPAALAPVPVGTALAEAAVPVPLPQAASDQPLPVASASAVPLAAAEPSPPAPAAVAPAVDLAAPLASSAPLSAPGETAGVVPPLAAPVQARAPAAVPAPVAEAPARDPAVTVSPPAAEVLEAPPPVAAPATAAEAASLVAPAIEVTAREAGLDGQPAIQALEGDAGAVGGEAGVGDGTGVPGRYVSELRDWLERHKRYPRLAQLRRQEGTVVVRFVMDRDGRVVDARVAESSGHRSLDQEAVAMVRRAAPLPGFPPEIREPRLSILVPVRFSLH